MSFTKDIYNLLIRFTKDSEGLDITLEDLRKLPWWRCVWGWWMAKAYYQLDGYYQRIEDIPEGLESYTIMNEVLTQHWMEQGIMKTQVITKAECKLFYGD